MADNYQRTMNEILELKNALAEENAKPNRNQEVINGLLRMIRDAEAGLLEDMQQDREQMEKETENMKKALDRIKKK